MTQYVSVIFPWCIWQAWVLSKRHVLYMSLCRLLEQFNKSKKVTSFWYYYKSIMVSVQMWGQKCMKQKRLMSENWGVSGVGGGVWVEKTKMALEGEKRGTCISISGPPVGLQKITEKNWDTLKLVLVTWEIFLNYNIFSL